MPPNDPADDAVAALRADGADREARRLQELRDYAVLDSAPEPSFDELVRAAAAIAGTSSAAVSLVDTDRQWFKAFINMKTDQTPRNMAFCDHVVRTELAMVIEDTYANPEFATHPAVLDDPDLRFYAGFPLRTPNGLVLGTLCVIDAQPRSLTGDQRMILETLATQVMARLQQRRELAEHERTVVRLAASETRYRYLVEQSTDVISRHRPDGAVVYVSPAVERLLGVDPLRPEAWDLTERTHPDDVEKLAEGWFAVLAGEERTVAGRMRHADGEYRYLELSLRPIHDGAGAVNEVLVTTRDATDRLRAEEELAAANAQITRYKEMLEDAERLSGTGSWAYHVDSGVTTASPELNRTYCLPPEQNVDMGVFYRMVHPDDLPGVEARMSEAGRTGVPTEFECRLTRPDGELRIVRGQLQAHLDDEGALVSFSGTTRDVTDEHRTRQDLEAARDLLDQVMNATSRTAVVTLHADGTVNAYNKGAEKLLGYTLEEAKAGHGFMDWHDPDEFVTRAQRYGLDPSTGPRVAIRGAELGEDEWTLIRKDGSRGLVSLEVTELHGPDGGRTGWLGFVHDVTEARRAQREAQEASEKFHQLLGAGTDQAIVGTDLEGAINLFNRGAELMTGWRADEVLGRRTWVVLPDPRFAAGMRGWEGLSDAEIDERLERMTMNEYVTSDADVFADPDRDRVWRRKDGSTVAVQLSVTPMHDTGGELVGMLGIATDITEKRRTERELVAARDQFEQLLGAATDQAIIGTDVGGGIVLFNAGAERMLGYDRDEVLGEWPWEKFHDQEELRSRAARTDPEGLRWASLLGQPGDQTPAGRQAVIAPNDPQREWTWLRKDGTPLTVQLSLSPMLGPDGEISGFVAIATDVTERRRAQRERDEHAAMMRAVIENNQSIIYVKDLEGRYLLVNQAYEQTHGITEAELLGRTDDLLYPERAAAWHAANMRAVDGAYAMEEFADLPDGRHWYDAVKVPLHGPDGELYGICGISLDVTARRKAEAEIRDALELAGRARDEALAANAAKSAFLATMSHEIRTPMNAVIGMTGLVLETPLDDEQRDLMETVRSSGDQLLAIINDILDFSKIEAGDLDLEFRPFDLHDLVEGTLAQFASTSHGLDLVSHVDDACPGSVIGDVIRLRQVLSNLVGNAVKFTAEGDVLVKVRVEGRTDGGSTDDERLRLRFDVQDTGIGVPPESMDRLFRSFSQVDASTTRTYGGTGLGLAISRALVTAMGGEIWVDSTPGVGSTFSFTVLVGNDSTGRGLADSHPGQAALKARLGGRRALVVDDNATNRRILRLQLRSYDMTCVDLATPAEALRLLADPAERFDLAILDLMMPVMDGSALAARIRAMPGRERLPLVLLSSVGARLREQERDFDVVLTKPVRSGQLIESIAKAISPTARLPVQATTSPATATEVAKLRILLAEDNEVNQKVGRLMLGKLGHTVEIAANGVEALNALHAGDYDVVLMDMHMPVMDGLEATRRIRAEVPAERQPTIIAMTASVTLEDREACAAAGMNGYLPKPVRAGDLTAALAELAGSPGAR